MDDILFQAGKESAWAAGPLIPPGFSLRLGGLGRGGVLFLRGRDADGKAAGGKGLKGVKGVNSTPAGGRGRGDVTSDR
jgi:hypothetical protein